MITVGIYSKREPIFVFVSAEEPCPESASQDLEPSLRERKKKKKRFSPVIVQSPAAKFLQYQLDLKHQRVERVIRPTNETLPLIQSQTIIALAAWSKIKSKAFPRRRIDFHPAVRSQCSHLKASSLTGLCACVRPLNPNLWTHPSKQTGQDEIGNRLPRRDMKT